MADFRLRPATRQDFTAIRALIRETGINPLGLEWSRFLVAESAAGEFIGCAQLKPHSDGSLELASLAVIPAWRGRGVARALIEAQLSAAPRPLYLTCRAELGPFYEQFGFHPLRREAMPPYFQRLSRLAEIIGKLLQEQMLVMKTGEP